MASDVLGSLQWVSFRYRYQDIQAAIVIILVTPDLKLYCLIWDGRLRSDDVVLCIQYTTRALPGVYWAEHAPLLTPPHINKAGQRALPGTRTLLEFSLWRRVAVHLLCYEHWTDTNWYPNFLGKCLLEQFIW